jgi:hypothetical protein
MVGSVGILWNQIKQELISMYEISKSMNTYAMGSV